MNTLILEYVRAGLGMSTSARRPNPDFDQFAGTWTEADETTFAEATSAFEEIDEELWR
jgi:hypothetical protein